MPLHTQRNGLPYFELISTSKVEEMIASPGSQIKRLNPDGSPFCMVHAMQQLKDHWNRAAQASPIADTAISYTSGAACVSTCIGLPGARLVSGSTGISFSNASDPETNRRLDAWGRLSRSSARADGHTSS